MGKSHRFWSSMYFCSCLISDRCSNLSLNTIHEFDYLDWHNAISYELVSLYTYVMHGQFSQKSMDLRTINLSILLNQMEASPP